MIDAVSFLVLILLAAGLSHAVMPTDRRVRLFWIVAPGMLLLFIVHPLALLFACACFACSIAIYAVARALPNARLRTRLPYAILLLLFVPDVLRLADEEPILWLGSAFFIIRQMMTVAQAVKNSTAPSQFVPALLLATFFFAALPSGPVFSGLRCWDALGQEAPPAYGDGCYRLFEGFVYLFAVAGISRVVIDALRTAETELLVPGGFAGILVLKLGAMPIAAFGFLFATFYGYSRMAEGTALLFGFDVPQNFNKPHLARDLGDFWKRWHRSMADFVMQYIYLPLLVTTAHAKLALIAAFVFMGLWHNLSLNFLVWGVGHGVGLAFLLPWAQQRQFGPNAMRVASLAYVVVLSAIAHGVWTT